MKNFEETIKQTAQDLKAGKIDLSNQEMFGGADTIFCLPGTVKIDPHNWYNSGDVVAESNYAAEISYLVFTFRDFLINYLGHDGRFMFYPALGRAVQRYVEIHGDNPGVIDEVAATGLEFAHTAQLYYFAYGSNMDIDQMEYRCPDARYNGPVFLDGHKLMADTAGYLTVEPCEENHVQGILWIVSICDIMELDRYEGVAYDCYRKDHMKVHRYDKDDTYGALIYISNRTPLSETSSLKGYMDRVIYAAEQWELEEDTLKQLRAIAKA